MVEREEKEKPRFMKAPTKTHSHPAYFRLSAILKWRDRSIPASAPNMSGDHLTHRTFAVASGSSHSLKPPGLDALLLSTLRLWRVLSVSDGIEWWDPLATANGSVRE